TSGGTDLLVVKGDGTNVINYTPDLLVSASGTLTVDGKPVAFQHLSPIDVFNAATFSFTPPPGGTPNNFQVANGPAFFTPGQAAIRISGTTNGGGTIIETAAVYNVTNVFVDTTGVPGSDTVTVTGADLSAAAANITNF